MNDTRHDTRNNTRNDTLQKSKNPGPCFWFHVSLVFVAIVAIVAIFSIVAIVAIFVTIFAAARTMIHVVVIHVHCPSVFVAVLLLLLLLLLSRRAVNGRVLPRDKLLFGRLLVVGAHAINFNVLGVIQRARCQVVRVLFGITWVAAGSIILTALSDGWTVITRRLCLHSRNNFSIAGIVIKTPFGKIIAVVIGEW